MDTAGSDFPYLHCPNRCSFLHYYGNISQTCGSVNTSMGKVSKPKTSNNRAQPQKPCVRRLQRPPGGKKRKIARTGLSQVTSSGSRLLIRTFFIFGNIYLTIVFSVSRFFVLMVCDWFIASDIVNEAKQSAGTTLPKERARISERSKFLQGLVPGCDKITGKATMLDEIINYILSLQH